MLRSRVGIALILMALLAPCACTAGPSFVVRDEPWRAEEERACLTSGLVRETALVTARSSVGSPGVCGALRPFKVAATARGSVVLEPPALVRCPMVHAIEYWTEHVVQPAARQHLRANVVRLSVAASYSCRPMNNVSGALLSEHGHANAVDVSGFLLEDGRVVRVETGWRGAPAERNFLHAVHNGSCAVFTTVLSPGYDHLHHDHFHLDLARHGGDGRICK